MLSPLSLLLLLLPVAAAAASSSALSFDGMFMNGAVLQQDAPTTVWGRGDAGQRIELALDGTPAAHAVVDASGRWELVIPPQPTSWARTLAVSDGSAADSSVSTVVKFGAVVLCSGQSNMGMPVAHWNPCCDLPPSARDPEKRCTCFAADNGTAESAAAGRYTGKISLASLQTPFPKPAGWRGDNCKYPWTNASCVSHPTWNDALPGPNGTVHGFSAVCWYVRFTSPTHLACPACDGNCRLQPELFNGAKSANDYMPSNRHYLILFGVYGVTLNEKACWSRYTGKSLFEQLDGKVPVGLLCGAVGGSPIEFWLPKGHVNNSICGADVPPCDPGGPNNYTDSEFFERLIAFFQPYTLGSVVWDQAERDVHCLPQPSPVC